MPIFNGLFTEIQEKQINFFQWKSDFKLPESDYKCVYVSHTILSKYVGLTVPKFSEGKISLQI